MRPGDIAVRFFMQPSEHLAGVDRRATGEISNPFGRQKFETEMGIEQREDCDMPVRKIFDDMIALAAGRRLGAGLLASVGRRVHNRAGRHADLGPKDGRHGARRGAVSRADATAIEMTWFAAVAQW